MLLDIPLPTELKFILRELFEKVIFASCEFSPFW